MATWDDVVAGVRDPPDVASSIAHEGSPAFDIRNRQFLRQRVEDGRPIVQFWVRDIGIQELLVESDPDIFWVHHRFKVPSTMGWLGVMDDLTLREVLIESWIARAPKTLVKAHPHLR